MHIRSDTVVRRERLAFINSVTKYPSIPCYHPMGERGIMADAPLSPPAGVPLKATEKIDGCNARIILLNGCYLIGSREELLTHSGDVVHNPSQGIVEALRDTADRLLMSFQGPQIQVIYGEVYGGKVGANAKNYGGAVGFRVFDILTLSEKTISELDRKSPSEIAAWRDGGGQRFMEDSDLEELCEMLRLPMVPEGDTLAGLPTSQADTLDWLRGYSGLTQAATDGQSGPAEGIVVRTEDRSWIVKIRREDYEKAARRKPLAPAPGNA